MNIKITEDSVTFKITEDELHHLLSGATLEKKVLIGQSDFVMVINPSPHEYFEDLKKDPLKLILDRSKSRLMLCATMDEINKLSDMGKSRDGLSAHVDGLDVLLQVDIRSDRRKRKQK